MRWWGAVTTGDATQQICIAPSLQLAGAGQPGLLSLTLTTLAQLGEVLMPISLPVCGIVSMSFPTETA